MQITRDTYESFFLDYLEGSLEESMVNEFLDFLEANPDLKKELHGFDKSYQVPGESITLNKSGLYRTGRDDDEFYNNQLVAWLEGDLSEPEAAKLLHSAESDSKLKSDLNLIGLTRLSPDRELLFSQRKRLYRKFAFTPNAKWLSAAAALLLIMLLIPTLLPEHDDNLYSGSTEPVENQQKVEQVQPESPVILTDLAVQSLSRKPVEQLPIQEDPKPQKFIAFQQPPPLPLPLKQGLLTIKEETQLLAGIQTYNTDQLPLPDSEDLYITERLLEKAGMDDFSLTKVLRAGLTLASDLSNDRFTYAVNSEGELTTLAVDTRLFGFRVAKGRVP